MNISLIALDLDGTLLNNASVISPANWEILRRAAAGGTRIVLASGRMPACITPYEKALGIDCHLMAYNGAACYGPQAEGRKRLFHQPVPPAFTATLIDLCTARDLFLNLYIDEVLYGIDRPDLRHLASFYTGQTGAVYAFVPDYTPFRDRETSKLLIVTTPPHRNKLYDELHARFTPGIHVVKTNPEYLEFLHPAVHKGNGLQALCRELAIPLEEVVAFGDGENDIELLATAGLGIAMANAAAKTKTAADRVSVFTNDEDGVAQELEGLIQ